MLLLLIALFQLPVVAPESREAAALRPPARAMAVTIDDLPTVSVLGENIVQAERTTRDLLAAIRRADVTATGFVNEGKLHRDGAVDPRRVALLQQWLDAGLGLGNHTFSHIDLHQTELKVFEQDVLEGERVTRRLLESKGEKPRYFRHPFLRTGRSLEVRDGLVSFLKAYGYEVAPVTIDNYDYIFAAAYDRAAAAKDAVTTGRITAAYLDYMESVVAYYEEQSTAILGREPAQTLLLHANALNAATFETLIARLRKRGYRFIALSAALKDPAYAMKDEYVGPGGITWLHRWALTQGMRGGIFAGEPEVPAWIRGIAAGR